MPDKCSQDNKNIKKFLQGILTNRVTFLCVILFVLIAAAVIVIICFSSRNRAEAIDLTAAAEILDDSKWTVNEEGFKLYDDPQYRTVTGIDVSEWNEDIDWDQVRKQGIEFVIVRVGYRGYVTGKFVFDERLSEYLKGASKAGLKIGAYFVSQAVNKEEAVEEAELVMEKLKGFDIEMPIYIDLEAVWDDEEEIRTEDLTKEELTEIAAAFCDTVEDAGFRGGIYANELWFGTKMDLELLSRYDIWLAKYENVPDSDIAFNMWQYSGEGNINGIDLWTDIDVRVEKKEADNE